MLFHISSALAQTAVAVPPPPGVPPILEWLWTVFGGLLLLLVTAATTQLKYYVQSQKYRATIANQQSRSEMLATTVDNAAHMALSRLDADGNKDIASLTWPGSEILQEAVSYVCVSRPETILATPQADEEHLARFILASMHRIQNQMTIVQLASDAPPPPAPLTVGLTSGRILPVEATVVPSGTHR